MRIELLTVREFRNGWNAGTAISEKKIFLFFMENRVPVFHRLLTVIFPIRFILEQTLVFRGVPPVPPKIKIVGGFPYWAGKGLLPCRLLDRSH